MFDVSKLPGTPEIYQTLKPSNLTTEQIRIVTQKLVILAKQARMKLAEFLVYVERNKLFSQWGYKTFDEYIQQELDIQRRSVYYLMDLWREFNEGPYIPEDVEKVGYTKSTQLARLSKVGIVQTREDAQAWVEKAVNLNQEQLKEEISKAIETKRKNQELPPDGTEVVHVTHFGLFDSQKSVVEDAIKEAQKISGSESRGHNLAQICLSFLSQGWTNKQEGLVDVCKKIESVFNVEIVCFERDSNQQPYVVYATPSLELIMK